MKMQGFIDYVTGHPDWASKKYENELLGGNMSRCEEAIALLKQLTDFLNVADPDAQALWDILAAFRGPDKRPNTWGQVPEPLKKETTELVRYAVGLKRGMFETHCANVGDRPPRPEDSNTEELKMRFGYADQHFLLHYAHAVRALKYFGLVRPSSQTAAESLSHSRYDSHCDARRS